jgi:hypothetical protein
VTGKGLSRKLFFIVIAAFALIISSFVAYSQESATCPVAAYEGTVVKLNPAAFDPDIEIGPAGRLIWEFGPPFNASGMWQTTKGKRGIFDFWVSVTDGELKDTEYSCVEVLPYNKNPVLAPVNDVYITRGQATNIEASCYDPDGDAVEINYRFNGKDVAYIMYEPPGVYPLEVLCTDSYGGIDTKKASLHILMDSVADYPKPTQQVIVPSVPQTAEKVELVLPASQKLSQVDLILPNASQQGIIEVKTPAECPPCPVSDNDVGIGEVEVVIYDSIYGLDSQGNRSNTFIIESEGDAGSVQPAASSGCEEGLERKNEINTVLGCCE